MVLVRQFSSSLPTPSGERHLVLSLRFLDSDSRFVSFYETEAGTASEEPFDLLLETRTPLSRLPTHAVWAEWRLDSPEDLSSFRHRAEALFETRRQNLDSFVLDWLLQSADHRDLVLVVGLYTSEDGARNLSRGHPAVAAFAGANPAPYAHNEAGISVFEVVQANLPTTTATT